MNTLIETAKAYETGKMLRRDSEVEIDVIEDDDGLYVCDYSEARGSAEPVKRICDADQVDLDKVIEICDKNNWAYCI